MTNFWTFCKFMQPSFFNVRENELKEIANAITEIYKNENGGNIAISAPPRYGKSTLSNYMIAWFIANDLDNAIIRASYGQKLSEELNQGVRDIIEDKKFTWIIGEELNIISNTSNKLRLKGKNRATLFATSVGGSTTGFGGNIIIADDLYKDHNEALSETVNTKTINWYHSAFNSRLDGKKQMIIFIGTRWRNNELIDQLEKGNVFSRVFKIKALNEFGNSFNEEIISTNELHNRKKLMHESIFNSMYQQEPMEALNPLLDKNEFKFIEKQTTANVRICVIDVANGGGDKTAVAMVDVSNNGIELIDAMTDSGKFENFESKINDFIKYYRPNETLIENNFNEIYILNYARKLRDETGLSIRVFKSTKNKQTKILLNAGKIQSMKIMNTNDYEYNSFIDNICKYDLSNPNQHDDEIDVLAMICDFVLKLKSKYNIKIWE